MDKPFSAYRGSDSYVFVCYSHEDEGLVYPEIGWLNEQGINLWYDEGISAGKIWREEIGDAIKAASSVLYYISTSSLASDHCDREINFALDQHKNVLPVYLEDVALTTDLEVGLGRVHALHRDKDTSYQQHLLNALGHSTVLDPSLTPVSKPPLGLKHGLKKPTRRASYVGLVALVALFLFGTWSWLSQRNKPATSVSVVQSVNSVTVVPFKAIGGDPDTLSFAQGATVDVRAALTATDLTLVSGSEADYVVEGFVRPAGDDVQVSVEFRRTRDHKVFFADSLVESTDRFRRAPYVARRIEGLIAIVDSVQRYTTNSKAAREALLDARIEWHKWALADGDPNIYLRHLRRALGYDPTYSAALTFLADAHADGYAATTTESNIELAHANIGRALVAVPDSTYILGKINYSLDLDYAAAIRNYDHHLRNPENASSYGHAELELCRVYLGSGDIDEAIRHCRRSESFGALGLQAIVLSTLGDAHFTAGHYNTALELFDRSLVNEGQDRGGTLVSSAKASFYLGDEAAANEKLDRVWRLQGEIYPEYLPGVMALLGRKDEALQILIQNEKKFPDGAVGWASPVNEESFWGHYHLGNLDEAFKWIDRGIENRSLGVITTLKSSTILNDLRSDPRFVVSMKRLREIESKGTPTHSVATECYVGPNARPPALVSCMRSSD